jgi:transposase-like protein
MAAGLHGCARTTPRVRAELQAAQEATRTLAARYGLDPKTVAKWRRRTTTADQPRGPSRPRSTVLSEAEETISSRSDVAPVIGPRLRYQTYVAGLLPRAFREPALTRAAPTPSVLW